MKSTFSILCFLIICASMVAASLEPRATPVPHHLHRRDTIVDGLDVSAILANPSYYLKEVSSLFKKHPEYASQFSKMTDKPAFIKSLSAELASQFGSKTAAIALQQYTAVNNANSPVESAAAAVGAAANPGATKVAAALSSASITASAGSPLSSAIGVLGSATSSASSISTSSIIVTLSIASIAAMAFNLI